MSTDRESAAAIEAAFFDAIAATPLDHVPRYVYADWLEEQLDVRAEYLRLACQWSGFAVNDPARAACESRMAQLVGGISPDWLARVVDVYPRNCPAAESDPATGESHCPLHWLMLKETRTPEVRHCDSCNRRVRFCANFRDVEMATTGSQPVAMEPSLGPRVYPARTVELDPRIAAIAKQNAARGSGQPSELAQSLGAIDLPLHPANATNPSPSEPASGPIAWLTGWLRWR